MSNLSRPRLDRWRTRMAEHVESGSVPGIVGLLSRRGETHVHAHGVREVGGAAMAEDTIFRIASMTKPVAAVAAMILVEECGLRLDDPVAELLPELAEPRVLRALDSPVDETVQAERPITVRHLMDSTFGHGIIMAPPGTYPVQDALAEVGLTPGPPQPSSTPDQDEWISLLATVPLLSQPGEKWWYDTAYDVLGILISRASGKPFDVFLRERIFEPLGMVDTGFHVPADKIDRLATAYTTEGDQLTVYDPAVGGQWSSPPAFASGRGGLVSTAADYLTFGRMLLDDGRGPNGRLLSRLSVRTMTTDQLLPTQKAGAGLGDGFFDSSGWGFGVSVVTRRTDIHMVPGRFGWTGGLGTTAQMDPTEDLVAIMLTQQAWTSPDGPKVYADFLTSSYQAIDD
ncbi:serine hydrolase domain-containing protein [Actinokineospora auranticolor]|uniref:CubicO group peptidase (Beta-lactamase class C family) n=1 Tax=Actinokineospora auranticolor TaxID=155976 RepID=A0A2S6GWT6_9PSEU|nr:serine hydrolase domain-containing protein [Actinokineospora auranticolor]PPK69640.1 CubicO group peptidase (beta-lactamase class C family) [Actinokineospora auranticolor]